VHETGTCRAWLGHIGNSSVRLDFTLTKAGDSEPAVTGHVVMVFVDRETLRPIPVPAALRQALSAAEGTSPETGDRSEQAAGPMERRPADDEPPAR